MAQLTEPTPVLTVTYYGHCAFLWETAQGARVLVDPYRNREDRYWFTREFPRVACDLGLITHAHFDHDAAGRLPESASLLRLPGELRYRDLSVRGIGDFHSNPRGTLSDFPNVMYRLEAGGLRFLHIGDNRADWPTGAAYPPPWRLATKISKEPLLVRPPPPKPPKFTVLWKAPVTTTSPLPSTAMPKPTSLLVSPKPFDQTWEPPKTKFSSASILAISPARSTGVQPCAFPLASTPRA